MTSPLLTDRLKAAFVAFFQELDPHRRYREFHEYRVLAGTGTTGFELQSISDDMPALTGVKIYGDDSAATFFELGTKVLVGFINGDPGRPFIAFDPAAVRHGDALGAVTLGAYIVQKVPPP